MEVLLGDEGAGNRQRFFGIDDVRCQLGVGSTERDAIGLQAKIILGESMIKKNWMRLLSKEIPDVQRRYNEARRQYWSIFFYMENKRWASSDMYMMPDFRDNKRNPFSNYRFKSCFDRGATPEAIVDSFNTLDLAIEAGQNLPGLLITN